MDASEYRKRAAEFRAAARIGTARPSQYLLDRAEEFENTAAALERSHSGQKPTRQTADDAAPLPIKRKVSARLEFYNFKVIQADGQLAELKGRPLADVDAAYRVAIDGIRALLSEDVVRGRIDLRGYVEVLDITMKIVMTIPFAAAVQMILPDPRPGTAAPPPASE